MALETVEKAGIIALRAFMLQSPDEGSRLKECCVDEVSEGLELEDFEP